MLSLLNQLIHAPEKKQKQIAANLQLTEQQLQDKLTQLRQLGLHIQENHQELTLLPELSPLQPNRLSQALYPYQVHSFTIIDSTNQYLLDHLAQLNKGDLCVADYQLAGRGRRGRQWQSAFAGQVILSCYWQMPSAIHLEGLSSIVGLSIVQLLAKLGVPDIQLKWPNDVLLQGKKLAGILIELAPQKNQQWQLIIGIGINLSFKQAPPIDQAWAQLIDYLPNLDRNQLIIQLVQQLYADLTLFEQQGLDPFLAQWQQFDAYWGQEVRLIKDHTEIVGIAKGINQQGYFQLDHAEQGRLYFAVGDVSLRKHP